MSDFRIVQMDIEKIKPYENNPRFNDKAVDAVAASIENFGFKVPIVVDKYNDRNRPYKAQGCTKVRSCTSSCHCCRRLERRKNQSVQACRQQGF